MGSNNGGDYWGWGCAIIAAFCCSCCVISEISTVFGSTGIFDSELSWVDGVDDVDI